MDRVQLFQQITAVHEHAVLGADALVHPFGGIGAGADRIAPREARLVLARETGDATRPEQQPREIAQRLLGTGKRSTTAPWKRTSESWESRCWPVETSSSPGG